MNTICYQLSEGAFITEADWPGLTAAQQEKEPGHQYWFVTEDFTTSELQDFLKNLKLHPLIMEDCLSSDHGTLIDRYSDAVYLEFPTNVGHDYGEIGYLSIISLHDLIVTIPRGEVNHLSDFIDSLQQDIPLTVGNTANVLYLLIDYFINKTITQSLAYKKRLIPLEKMAVHDSDDLDPNLITDFKRQVTQLESVCEDQLYCAKSLVKHTDTVLNTAGQEVFFDDLVSDAEQGLRSISRLNDRVKDLKDNFTLQHHEFSEKRLRILTIISAIFLPLTFITGFFGMNFIRMRMIELEYGPIIAVGIMFIITMSLLWYFTSRGWFN